MSRDVIIMGLLVDGRRCDAPGKLIGPISRGPSALSGLTLLVEFKGVRICVEPGQVCDRQEYMDAYNANKPLPLRAVGELSFLEYADMTPGGALLDQMITVEATGEGPKDEETNKN